MRQFAAVVAVLGKGGISEKQDSGWGSKSRAHGVGEVGEVAREAGEVGGWRGYILQH